MLSSSFDLPVDAATPSAARRVAAVVLRQWDVPDDGLDAALLVLSELVTNAVVHGQPDTPVRVGLELDAAQARLLVAVVDGSPHVPEQRQPSADAESGRGLALVAALASDWGVETVASGKRVYVELALAASRCA